MIGFEQAGNFNGRGGAEAPVHFHEDFHLRAHRLADRRHQFHRANLFRAGKLHGARAKGVNLQGLVTLFQNHLHALGEFLRRALHRVPGVRVGLDLFVALPAQQPPHRLAHGLADDVPAGDFNPAHHRGGNHPAAPEVVAVHAQPKVLDVKGIGAQNVPPHRTRSSNPARLPRDSGVVHSPKPTKPSSVETFKKIRLRQLVPRTNGSTAVIFISSFLRVQSPGDRTLFSTVTSVGMKGVFNLAEKSHSGNGACDAARIQNGNLRERKEGRRASKAKWQEVPSGAAPGTHAGASIQEIVRPRAAIDSIARSFP